MDKHKELNRLLEELHTLSNISFSIDKNNITDIDITLDRLRHLIGACKCSLDISTFLSSAILGSLNSANTFEGMKRFNIDTAQKFHLFLISFNSVKADSTDLISIISQSVSYDLYTGVINNGMLFALIQIPDEYDTNDELYEIASTILANINIDLQTNVHIAYSSKSRPINEINQSYSEAIIALEIGKTFYHEDYIYSYDKLGIGRLIYALPKDVCASYIKEIFGQTTPEQFDSEMMLAINAFFEHGLNVTETAASLYIHRNTLIYRIKKLEKLIGLDLFKFEDAMKYKIAIMVYYHLKSAN